MNQFASYEIVKSRAALAAARVEALRRAGVLGGRGPGRSAWDRLVSRLAATRLRPACCPA